jgi:hypothetical protein
VATYLVSATGSDAAPAIYLIVVALLVFPAVFLLPEIRGLSLLRGAKEGPKSAPTRPGRSTLMVADERLTQGMLQVGIIG